MKRRTLAAIAALLAAAACASQWERVEAPQTLGSVIAEGVLPSRKISLRLPDGWCRVKRGDDLVATRDGVFLENVVVERLHVGATHSSDGAFPSAAVSSKLWPLRTARFAPAPLARGFTAEDLAAHVLESRRNNPGILDFAAGDVVPAVVAGQPGFRTTATFRLDLGRRRTPFRSLLVGFVAGDWGYLVTFTAAARHCFDRDAPAFEPLLASLRLEDEAAEE